MIRINCDIGEREKDNPTDLALMKHIHIANIACGGHAGNEETVNVFKEIAEKHRVKLSAHLSYPDKEHFGRVSMDMPLTDLLESLDIQLALMPAADMVKFHGALYHDACNNPRLAEGLALWLSKKNIRTLITPNGSEIHKAAEKKGLEVLREAFAERRYQYEPDRKKLGLMDRRHDGASMEDADEALRQCLTLIRYGFVEAFVENPGGPWTKSRLSMACDTLCLHSDSVIALALAPRLYQTIMNETTVYV